MACKHVMKQLMKIDTREQGSWTKIMARACHQLCPRNPCNEKVATWHHFNHRHVCIFYRDTVLHIHVVSYHVATDKPTPKMATSSGLFLATIYNQSQVAERKHVARYLSINTAATAVPLSAHPSPIDVAAATAEPMWAKEREFTALFSCICESVKDVC